MWSNPIGWSDERGITLPSELSNQMHRSDNWFFVCISKTYNSNSFATNFVWCNSETGSSLNLVCNVFKIRYKVATTLQSKLNDIIKYVYGIFKTICITHEAAYIIFPIVNNIMEEISVMLNCIMILSYIGYAYGATYQQIW